MTSYLQADCLETGINSGPNTRIAYLFTFYDRFHQWSCCAMLLLLLIVFSKESLCQSWMLSTVSAQAQWRSVHVSRRLTFLTRQQHNLWCRFLVISLSLMQICACLPDVNFTRYLSRLLCGCTLVFFNVCFMQAYSGPVSRVLIGL